MKRIVRRTIFAILALALPTVTVAHYARFDGVGYGARGSTAVNPHNYSCSQPATTTIRPCSPIVTSSAASASGPIAPDSSLEDFYGNSRGYVAHGPYQVEIYGPKISGRYAMTDQRLGTALEYFSSDAVIYVSTSGNDSDDGLSAATAKLTIGAAYSALPSCTFTNHYYSGSYTNPWWAHCGKIFVGAGTFNLFSQIRISSPYVEIRGDGPNATQLNFSGTTGCAIYWTENPFPDEFSGFGGVFDLRIDGYYASAGACGLETDDASAFRADNLLISNFSGIGSIGWYDHATHWYNEKDDVHIQFLNNTTDWQITPASSAPGYPGATTFGYGRFNIECEVFTGQTCLSVTNGTLSQSFLKLTVNIVQTNASGIVITNNGSIQGNQVALHVEGPRGGCCGTGYEINAPANSFANVGLWTQDSFANNSASTDQPGWSQYWPQSQTLDNNTASANIVHRFNPCPVGGGVSGCQVYDLTALPGTTYIKTQLPVSSGRLEVVIGSGTSSAIGGSALTAGSCASGNVMITGAAVGATPPMVATVQEHNGTFLGGSFSVRALITASNTVTVEVCAVVAGTPTSTTYDVKVIQ